MAELTQKSNKGRNIAILVLAVVIVALLVVRFNPKDDTSRQITPPPTKMAAAPNGPTVQVVVPSYNPSDRLGVLEGVFYDRANDQALSRDMRDTANCFLEQIKVMKQMQREIDELKGKGYATR